MQKKSELSFPDQFYVMDEQLTIAKFSFVMYRLISLDTSTLSASEHNKLARNYQNFVKAQRAVIGQTLMVQIHKFFDPTDRSIQMNKIIDQCGTKSGQLTDKYAKLQSDHSGAIKILRNRVYAHTDIYEKPKDIFKDIETTYTDLLMIIEELEIIMQEISEELKIVRMPGVESDLVEEEFEALIMKGIA